VAVWYFIIVSGVRFQRLSGKPGFRPEDPGKSGDFFTFRIASQPADVLPLCNAIAQERGLLRRSCVPVLKKSARQGLDGERPVGVIPPYTLRGRDWDDCWASPAPLLQGAGGTPTGRAAPPPRWAPDGGRGGSPLPPSALPDSQAPQPQSRWP
jgi:hypothetical protein